MLIGFLTFLFVLICLVLTTFILLQQGKGDMGLGSLGGGSQMLFGGSGGQEFFVKMTWIFGALFIFGALGLAILKSKQLNQSKLAGFTLEQEKPAPTAKQEEAAAKAKALGDESEPATPKKAEEPAGAAPQAP